MEYVPGIKPAAPGYARVRVEPHLGAPTSLDAAAVHPHGLIGVRYAIRNGQLQAPSEIAGRTGPTEIQSPSGPRRREWRGGHTAGPHTTSQAWRGERIDIGWAIDVLRAMDSGRAPTTG